jgi:hypothetical protein
MPVILATQEAEIRKISVQSQPGQIVPETLSLHKRGLVEWLKVKALSLDPVPQTNKKWNGLAWVTCQGASLAGLVPFFS